MYWDDIAGHTGVINILQNMLASGRMPHALLFTGPAGIGKMLVARILAAALLCAGEASKPCGECLSCQKARQKSHPDLIIVPNEGGSLKIDQVRGLQQEVALTPYYGKGRVFIIEEAERMTAQAANSLLKLLEEPPAGTVFILTASSPYALLPTIVSRCRIMPFQPLSYQALTDLLTKQGADSRQAAMAARFSGGRVGMALATLAPGGLDLRDQAAQIIEALPTAGPDLVWQLSGTLDKMESEDFLQLLRNFSYILRDLMVIKLGQEELLYNADISERLGQMADAWEEGRLTGALADVGQANRAIESNANTRLICEALLIKLMDAVKGGE